MYFRLVAVLFLSANLLGCVSTAPIPKLPDTLEGDGLLVGEIYMPGSYRWTSSQVTINGRIYNASLRDGYLAIKLAPGEYTIENLRTQGWDNKVSANTVASPYVKVRSGGGYRAPTYYYSSPGQTIYYTLLPLNRKVTIEANRITSLGLSVFLVDPKDPKKFYTANLDNQREMTHFLNSNYPKLMATIQDRSFVPVAARYFDTAKLSDLRRLIADKEATRQRLGVSKSSWVVFGGAGTAVLFTTNKKDAPANAQVLDTGTLAQIKSVVRQGERLSLLSADGRMTIVDQGKTLQRDIPFPVQMLTFRRSEDGHSIVAIDNRRRFLVSIDDGITWTEDETAILEEPTNLLDMYATAEGAYVYSRNGGVPNTILLHAYNSSPAQFIPPPRESGKVNNDAHARLFTTDRGLYIDYYHAVEFHFKPKDHTQWQIHAMPTQNCGYLVPVDKTLTVNCAGVEYNSDDDGMHWTKQPGASVGSS